MNKFDRIGDWEKFSKHMKEYLKSPQAKYSSSMMFNDLCHYTGLRIMVWNMLKYALRLWTCAGKVKDFEKSAHYSQMAWTLKERHGRKPPFFKEDVEGDYVVLDVKDDETAYGNRPISIYPRSDFLKDGVCVFYFHGDLNKSPGICILQGRIMPKSQCAKCEIQVVEYY